MTRSWQLVGGVPSAIDRFTSIVRMRASGDIPHRIGIYAVLTGRMPTKLDVRGLGVTNLICLRGLFARLSEQHSRVGRA